LKTAVGSGSLGIASGLTLLSGANTLDMTNNATNTLTLGGGTGAFDIESTSNINLNVSGTSLADKVAGGLFKIAGGQTLTVNLTPVGSYQPGLFNLISYTSESGISIGSSLLLNSPALPPGITGFNLIDNTGTKNIQLQITGIAPINGSAYWTNSQGTNSWSTFAAGNNTNWSTSPTGTPNAMAVPGSPTDVHFAASGVE
jgi:hypothetical protein